MINANIIFTGFRGSYCYQLEIADCTAADAPRHILHNMPMGSTIHEARLNLKELNANRKELGLATFCVSSLD